MKKIDYWHDMADEEDSKAKTKEEAEWRKGQFQFWFFFLIFNLFFLVNGICITLALAVFAPWTVIKDYILLTIVLTWFFDIALTSGLFSIFKNTLEKIFRGRPFT